MSAMASPLAVLTSVGACRRLGGHRHILVAICGVAFPITWMAWYAIDTRATTRSAAQAPQHTPAAPVSS
jgi:hypothetical protein